MSEGRQMAEASHERAAIALQEAGSGRSGAHDARRWSLR